MSKPTINIATPTSGALFPFEYIVGTTDSLLAMPGQILHTCVGGSFLPRNRDLIVSRFLANGCDYLLSVDDDIGWVAGNIQQLIDADVDLISGIYVKKQDGKSVATVGLPPGEMVGGDKPQRAISIPGGFFLMKRSAAERMSRHYAANEYVTDAGETTVMLHNPYLAERKNHGEDVSFSHRWLAMGGELWAHPQCVVKHVGRKVYLPEGWS